MSGPFRHWVEQYQDHAWTLARYLLRDADEAEDVCQEAFLKLWHHQHEVDPGKVKPWLMKVTRNGCLDRLRRRRPAEELTDSHTVDGCAGPAEDARRQELGDWLRRAIAALPEPYRSLVVLRDVQENSYEDVATALELSLVQVKVYLHRARKQLRARLAEVRP